MIQIRPFFFFFLFIWDMAIESWLCAFPDPTCAFPQSDRRVLVCWSTREKIIIEQALKGYKGTFEGEGPLVPF